MSLLTRYHLFRLAQRVRLDSGFLSAMETKLFSQKDLHHLQRARFLRWAVAPALLIISLLTSTGTYAYVSDQVLPDHALYPLRQSVEGFAVQIASVTGMKDRVRLKQLERRAREKKLLQQRAVPVKKDTNAKKIVVPDLSSTPTSTKVVPKPLPKKPPVR